MINAKHFSPCLHNFITLKSSMSPVVYIVAAGTFSQAALIVVIEINSTKPSTLFLLWTSRRCSQPHCTGHHRAQLEDDE